MARGKLARAEAQDLTLVEAVDRYILDHHEYRGSTDKTIKDARNKLSLFVRFARDRGFPSSVRALTEEHARAWVADLRKRGRASASVHAYVRSLKAWTNWLAHNPSRSPILPSDPLEYLARPKLQDTAKPTIDLDQVAEILRTRSEDRISGLRDRALMLVLLSTGLRRAELLGLQVDDLDPKAKTLHVRLGKGQKFRVVPIGIKAIKVVDEYLDARRRLRQDDEHLFLTQNGTPLTAAGCRRIFDRIKQQTGITCNPHAWRRTHAVEFLRGGGRQEHLMVQLGHTTMEMTRHYARISQADLIAEHRVADPTRRLKIA